MKIEQAGKYKDVLVVTDVVVYGAPDKVLPGPFVLMDTLLGEEWAVLDISLPCLIGFIERKEGGEYYIALDSNRYMVGDKCPTKNDAISALAAIVARRTTEGLDMSDVYSISSMGPVSSGVVGVVKSAGVASRF